LAARLIHTTIRDIARAAARKLWRSSAVATGPLAHSAIWGLMMGFAKGSTHPTNYKLLSVDNRVRLDRYHRRYNSILRDKPKIYMLSHKQRHLLQDTSIPVVQD
jgi:hypothetical protein